MEESNVAAIRVREILEKMEPGDLDKVLRPVILFLKCARNMRDAIASNETSEGFPESARALESLTDEDLLHLSAEAMGKLELDLTEEINDTLYTELWAVATNADNEEEKENEDD